MVEKPSSTHFASDSGFRLFLRFVKLIRYMHGTKKQVIVVGGGLAGLNAAKVLQDHGASVTLLEKDDRLGGRVRTDKEQGFTLDVGFQILLTSYPELSSEWKSALGLKSYRSGARIFTDKRWCLLANPFVDPRALFNWPKGTLKGLYSLAKALFRSPPPELTKEYIIALAASKEWKEAFLQPFMRGVLLDQELSAPTSRFIELMTYFLKGSATLPDGGMEQIPTWLAKKLNKTTIRLQTEVVEASSQEVRLSSGERLTAEAVLLALPLPALKRFIPDLSPFTSLATTNDYFAIESNFVSPDRYLWLQGSNDTPVNNFSFPSAVQPGYSPKGFALLSASSLGQKAPTIDSVQDYLAYSLGLSPKLLKPIKRYYIPHALPLQQYSQPVQDYYWKGFFISGEAVSPPSINDALASGRTAAQKLLERIR